jgi:DNA-binding SARP family transcriptional activator
MIHIRLLGGLDLRGADGAAFDAALRQPKRLAVLIYLVCARPRGFHRRDKLAALFWPELADERARAALRTTLTRLRDDLGADVLVSRGADELAVDGDRVRCDVLDLEQRLAGDDALAAAALYTGPFLDGVHVEGVAEEFESWVAQERSRMVGALVAALRAHGERARSAGDLDLARRALVRAAELAPVDELLARELIGLLLVAGDRGSALASYERLRARLGREFSVAPSAETTALVAPLLAEGGPSVALPTRGRTPRRESTGGEEDAVGRAAVPGEREPGRAATRLDARTARGLAVLAVLGSVVVGLAVRRPSTDSEPPPAWTSVRASTGTALQLTSPAVVLDSTEDALLIVHGAETFHPLRTNPRVMRLRGISGDVATWTTLEPAPGRAPRPRYSASVAYDRSADRLFLFGGAFGTTSPCGNDVWVLEQASGVGGTPRWRELVARDTAPGERNAATMAFDAARERLIVHGGTDCFTVHHTDTWILQLDDSSASGGRWIPVRTDSAAGAPQRAPGGAVAIDVDAGRVLLVAGFEDVPRANAVWVLEGLHAAETRAARWRRMACEGAPSGRIHGSLLWDAVRGEGLLFGGFNLAREYSNELWRLRGLEAPGADCRWELVRTAARTPPARGGAAAHLRGTVPELVIFGGFIEISALNDLWRIPLGGPAERP